MATYRDAVRRLQVIYNECSPQVKENQNPNQKKDGFTQLKKKIHQDVKDTRQLIKDREELLSIKPGSKEAAEASFRIRNKMKALREDAVALQNLQRQEASKKSKASVESLDAANRQEVVQLVFKHIEELEELEKKRFTDKLASDRSALFSGAAVANVKIDFSGKGKYDSNLPDIDPDPETAEDLRMLKDRNQEIDADLEQIGQGVSQLKEIAINMKTELDKQNEMLDEVDKKVDKAQDHLDNVNLKMKTAIENVMKGDKFIVNCVLLCILLALVGFIAAKFLE